jgi:hypothetical protein
VEVKGVVNDPGLLLIMEYLPMGSLLDYFRICYTKPNSKQLLKFAQDIAEVGIDSNLPVVLAYVPYKSSF